MSCRTILFRGRAANSGFRIQEFRSSGVQEFRSQEFRSQRAAS
jgi:hypothetical protein